MASRNSDGIAADQVSLNGLIMKAHPILLNDDGTAPWPIIKNLRPLGGLRLAGNDLGAYRIYRLWLTNSQMILLLDNFGISPQLGIRS